MSANKFSTLPIQKELAAYQVNDSGNWASVPSWISQVSVGSGNTFSSTPTNATANPDGVWWAQIPQAGAVGDSAGLQTLTLSTFRSGAPIIEFEVSQWRTYISGAAANIGVTHDLVIAIQGASAGCRLEWNQALQRTQMVFVNGGTNEVIEAWRVNLGANFAGRKMQIGLRLNTLDKTCTVLMYGEEIETFKPAVWPDFAPADMIVRGQAYITRRAALAAGNARINFGAVKLRWWTT
jgi:hypothetical protein